MGIPISVKHISILGEGAVSGILVGCRRGAAVADISGIAKLNIITIFYDGLVPVWQ